jgi:soluble lytic murein transglycosylase-like protein
LYDPYILQASAKHRLDPELVKAVIRQESNYNPNDVSNKGAQGLMQLMPETAKGLGVRDAFDPWENIHGGTRYLRYMLEAFNGDVVKALAAYNAGPYAVRKYGTVPPYRETQQYVRSVMRYYRQYRGEKLHAYEDRSGRLVITDQAYLP